MLYCVTKLKSDEFYCVTKNSHILLISLFICSFFFLSNENIVTFFLSKISHQLLDLKFWNLFGTKLDSDELYCVTQNLKSQIYYISPFICSLFFLSNETFFLSKISQQLLDLRFWNLFVLSLIVMSCIVLQKQNSHILLISPFICSLFFLSKICQQLLDLRFWNLFVLSLIVMSCIV